MTSASNRILADVDLEQQVLGSILLSDRSLKPLVVDEHLTVDTFHRDQHRRVFAAMLELAARGTPVDVSTVVAELERRGELDVAGGRDGVDALGASVPTAGNVRFYGRRLVELQDLRQVQLAGFELVAAVETEDHDAIAAAEQMLAQRGRRESDVATGEQLRAEAYDYLATGDAGDAFPFPWSPLNDAMGGMRRQDTTFVGAWTNHGKSPLADQVLDHVATNGEGRTVLYANEGNRRQRTLRNVARRADVNLTRLERRRLDDRELGRVHTTLEHPLPYSYVDIAGWPPAAVARHMQWDRADVVCIDHLHNFAYRDANELDDIVRTLVQAAVIANCHLLLVGQFNEERAKNEEAPRPVLRDIRGSGMVKNACANVLFLWRRQDVDEHGRVRLEPASEIYFAKVRYGQLAGIEAHFTGSRQRFDYPPPTLASVA